jgi:hypothetical protein
VVVELWAVEAFVLRLLLLVSSSWLVLSVLEMQVFLVKPFVSNNKQELRTCGIKSESRSVNWELIWLQNNPKNESQNGP